MSSRPPWFPGQYGRPDDAGATFSGEPYADGSGTEPYAPASLHTDVSNPYGDVPARPAGDDSVWLVGAAPGDGAAGPASSRPADRGEAGAPTGYDSFYEPGGRSRSSWKPRKRRKLFRSARRHGPRGADRNGPGLVVRAPEVVEPGTAPAPEIEVKHPRPPTGRRRAPLPSSVQAGTRSTRSRLAVAGVGVGVVLVLAVTYSALAGEDADPALTGAPTTSSPSFSPLPTPSPLASPTAVVPPAGEVPVAVTVDDDGVRVEVLGFTTGVSELAGATASTTASGEYVVVRLRATALAPSAWFLDTDQRLTDAAGTEHLPDPAASMAVDGNSLWLTQLPQGESVEGVVVFDVPVGTLPTTLTVHGSPTGVGAPVALPGG